ncbi:MAG: oxalurate catabolism protein HpxZ [Nocardioidaceae bacterium]
MISKLEVDLPEVVAEVTAAFRHYERALMSNDVETLNALFWDDPATVRFGVREELYGWTAVAAYRRGRPPAPPRELLRTRITTFGRDAAVAVTEYLEEGARQIGRQTQTWVRLDVGWRIVNAHVSLPPMPGSTDQI